MSITPVPVSVRKVHIYQLSNHTRLESLLVVTEADAAQVLAQLRREPPPEAAFWRLYDNIEEEIMAQHMTEASAEQFLKMYLEHMQNRTWRFRVWRP
jgi:hypothetical protein